MTLLGILDDLNNNAAIWMFSACPTISSTFSPLTKRKAPNITIIIIIIIIVIIIIISSISIRTTTVSNFCLTFYTYIFTFMQFERNNRWIIHTYACMNR